MTRKTMKTSFNVFSWFERTKIINGHETEECRPMTVEEKKRFDETMRAFDENMRAFDETMKRLGQSMEEFDKTMKSFGKVFEHK